MIECRARLQRAMHRKLVALLDPHGAIESSTPYRRWDTKLRCNAIFFAHSLTTGGDYRDGMTRVAAIFGRALEAAKPTFFRVHEPKLSQGILNVHCVQWEMHLAFDPVPVAMATLDV